MTTISNLFYFDDLNNKNSNNPSKRGNSKLKSKNIIKGDNYTSPALSQGKNFHKYQDKIIKHLEKDINKVNSKEGFQNNSSNQENGGKLINETNQVLKQTNISSQKQNLSNLHTKYGEALYDYENEIENISGIAQNYFNRVNPSNQYLGKNIQFSNGTIAYVTQQGVVKMYENQSILTNTAGQNGCPASTPLIGVKIPWSPEYNNAGVTIPTTPELVSGTPMQQGQSCGNEGSNVFVNQIITNPNSTYAGTYADNPTTPLMTFVGGAPTSFAAVIQNGNFQQPQIGNNTYQYINSNSTVIGWNFNAVLINNSSAWEYPMPYPFGSQAGCIQGLQTFSQFINFVEGTYTLSFYACGRPGYSGANTISVTIGSQSSGEIMNNSFTPPITEWTQYNYDFTIQDAGSYLLEFNGTINNIDNSTAIQNIQITADTSTSPANGSYTYSECQQSAIDGGYQYFALQNVNTSDSTGYCAVSNDLPSATSLGESMAPNGQNLVWSSRTTGQTGNTAILTNTGSLSVLNSSGQAVFNTPNSYANPSNYLGCYADQPTRAMNLYNNGSQQYNLQECQQIAQNMGATYFGLQNSTSGTNAQCVTSSDWSQASEYGTATNCTKISNGSWSGGGFSNAVYNTNSSQSNYILVLTDAGTMTIQRGTSPTDNQGQIWTRSATVTTPNPAYSAANGKYGQNWIANGSTLAAGDFIGSPSGYIALIMQSNGNLVLYSFTETPNTLTMNDGNIGGGPGANAIYNIGEVGFPSNLTSLAYIDQNAELHPYPSTNSKYRNTYTTFSGLDSSGNDIANLTYSNATVEQCTKTCNAEPTCAGFTFNTNTNTCYPKNSNMYPAGPSNMNASSSIYMRNSVPKNMPMGVPSTTNNIDSVLYQNYINGGDFSNEYGLISMTNGQKQKLTGLQNNLQSLSGQMASLNNNLNQDNYKVTGQTLKNMKGLDNYTDNLLKTKKQIKYLTQNNMNGIVEDSDIVVLQENYNYLFWSILAVGSILVSMNVLK